MSDLKRWANKTPAMITIDKLRIYKRYSGDIDGWARVSDTKEKQIMADSDWSDIGLLIHQLSVLKNNLVGDDYAKEIRESLKSKTSDSKVEEELLKLIR